MNFILFGKKCTTNDGKKTFFRYFANLKKNDGTELPVSVKFRDECGNPKNVPCVITIDKKDANLSKDKYIVTDEEGIEIEKTKDVLWISAFKESEYVDHSLDDFE